MNRDELITNRTLADVHLRNDKGTLNVSDLNRIEEWCRYLADTLNQYAYYVDITTKTDWTMLDIPKLDDINRIKNNLESLKKAYYSLQTTPTITTGKKTINYRDANDIEKILFDIDYLIKKMEGSFRYSNTFYSGTDLYLPYNAIL